MIRWYQVENRMVSHAGSRPSPQLYLGRRYRRLHARGRTGSPNAIDGEPADHPSGKDFGLSAFASKWTTRNADRARREARELCAADSFARARSPRGHRAAGERGRLTTWRSGGLRRLSTHQALIGVYALAPGIEA